MTTSTLTPKLNSNDHLNQHKSWHQHHYQQKAALSFDSCYKRFNLTDWKAILLKKKRFSGHGGYDGVDGSDDDGWVDTVLLQPIWGWWVPSGVCTPSQVILNVILLAIFHHFEIQVWPTVFLWHSDTTNKCLIFHLTPVDNTVTESFLYQLLFIFWKITRVKTYGRSRGKFMTALFGLEQDMSTWGEVYSLPASLLHTHTRAHYELLTERFSRIFQGPESSEPLLHC